MIITARFFLISRSSLSGSVFPSRKTTTNIINISVSFCFRRQPHPLLRQQPPSPSSSQHQHGTVTNSAVTLSRRGSAPVDGINSRPSRPPATTNSLAGHAASVSLSPPTVSGPTTTTVSTTTPPVIAPPGTFIIVTEGRRQQHRRTSSSSERHRRPSLFVFCLRRGSNTGHHLLLLPSRSFLSRRKQTAAPPPAAAIRWLPSSNSGCSSRRAPPRLYRLPHSRLFLLHFRLSFCFPIETPQPFLSSLFCRASSIHLHLFISSH